MEEIIFLLRKVAKSYRVALKNGIVPKEEEENYDGDFKEYVGMEADQLALVMCNLISRM